MVSYLAWRRVTKHCQCKGSKFNEPNSVSLQALALPAIATPAYGARDAVALAVIPPVKGSVHWPASQAGAPERNEAINHTARSNKQDSKEQSGYHRRSLVENLMYRVRTLTGTAYGHVMPMCKTRK